MNTLSPANALVDLKQAAEILESGGVCAFATETVYGLGADAGNADAVVKIYEIKGRPRFNPLIVHCATREMAESLVLFDDAARKLADAFWPGPLTLVLPLRRGAAIADLVSAGLDTLAVRMPAHELARQLIATVGRPLAAPSANPSGRLSPTKAEQVISDFDGSVPVLDGGVCAAGVESTIIACRDGATIQLRAGAITHDDIEQVLGFKVSRARQGDAIAAPGMLARHYAPRARLYLGVSHPEAGMAYLGFGEMPETTGPMRNLSPAGDLAEAARNLFAMLRELDASGVAEIGVAPIPETGLGEAINDRLTRAAARE